MDCAIFRRGIIVAIGEKKYRAYRVYARARYCCILIVITALLFKRAAMRGTKCAAR